MLNYQKFISLITKKSQPSLPEKITKSPLYAEFYKNLKR